MTVPVVFLDAEFTSLESPRILSIGLVSGDGAGRHVERQVECYVDFYVELTRTEANVVGASEFVLDTVLPQFGLVPMCVDSVAEIGAAVGEWLLGLGAPSIEVAYDYHTDFDLLEHVLVISGYWDRLRTVLVPNQVGYLHGDADFGAAMEASWTSSMSATSSMSQFAAGGITRHHALADARALRCGFIAVHGIGS